VQIGLRNGDTPHAEERKRHYWKAGLLLLTGGVLLLLSTSCAPATKTTAPPPVTTAPPPKSMVVLLSDPDGKTGEVVVANKGGSQVLTQSGHATEIEDATAAPSTPVQLDDSQITKTFGPALAAMPEPPKRYLLYFESSSTNLTADSEKLILEILSTVKTRQSIDVSIVGHTDRKGPRQLNYRLALDRALAIKNLLISKGVDPASIETESHGEDNPLIRTEDEVEEPRNRRVEVTVR
jgi:outer membrane protein OmpA-like peptidoglycan-associated protein